MKIQLSNLKDQIGFTESFMNWAAESCWEAEKERFLKAERKQGKKKKPINNDCIVLDAVALLRQRRGLPPSVEQEMPVWLLKGNILGVKWGRWGDG